MMAKPVINYAIRYGFSNHVGRECMAVRYIPIHSGYSGHIYKCTEVALVVRNKTLLMPHWKLMDVRLAC